MWAQHLAGRPPLTFSLLYQHALGQLEAPPPPGGIPASRRRGWGIGHDRLPSARPLGRFVGPACVRTLRSPANLRPTMANAQTLTTPQRLAAIREQMSLLSDYL